MELLSGPLAVGAAVLVVAGALKLVDPAPTVGALRQLGLPSGPLLVRALAATEVAVGASALALGGAVPAALVALSYLAATAVVIAALRSGTMIGSCGCFGRDDTPPEHSHVLLNLALASLAGAAALAGAPAPTDVVADAGLAGGLVTVGAIGLSSWLVVVAYTALPRAGVAVRRSAEHRAERSRIQAPVHLRATRAAGR